MRLKQPDIDLNKTEGCYLQYSVGHDIVLLLPRVRIGRLEIALDKSYVESLTSLYGAAQFQRLKARSCYDVIADLT